MTIPPPASTRPNQCLLEPSLQCSNQDAPMLITGVRLDPSCGSGPEPSRGRLNSVDDGCRREFRTPRDAPAGKQGIEHFAW